MRVHVLLAVRTHDEARYIPRPWGQLFFLSHSSPWGLESDLSLSSSFGIWETWIWAPSLPLATSWPHVCEVGVLAWCSVLSASLAHSSSHQWTISSPPALGLLVGTRHVKCRKPVVLSASVTSAVMPWTLMEEIVQWFTVLSELKLKQLWSTGTETSGICKDKQAIPDRAEDQKLLRHRQGPSKMFLGV